MSYELKTALFTYRRRVSVKGAEKFNDNYINPLNVTSFFWEENDEGKLILNVFLNAVRTTASGSNAYSIRFSETVGCKFVQHMEDFLRYLIASPANHAASVHTRRTEMKASRRPVDAEIVEEDHTGDSAQWVQP